MLNLLPEDMRMIHRSRVYARAAVVWGVTSLFLLLSGLLLLAPAYFYTTVRAKKTQEQVQSEQKSHEASEIAQNALQDYSQMAKHIQAHYEVKPMYDVLAAIEKEMSLHDEVTVNEYTFMRDKEKRISVVVSGVGPSRESLLKITRAFQNNPKFKDATIPISELAGKQGVFTFTLTLHIAS